LGKKKSYISHDDERKLVAYHCFFARI